MDKIVFISSTYKDLAEHRRQVWRVLEGFKVEVKGMEKFGARSDAPLATCLAEVGQSDVYVGIFAFRLGNLSEESGKSMTQLEYEEARRLEKEILIYIADEQARFREVDFDLDEKQRAQLDVFKDILKKRHTYNPFSTPEDLAEKVKADFAKRFLPSDEKGDTKESEFDSTLELVRRFRLLPGTVNGREIRLEIAPIGSVFPANRALCKAFNLEYGSTIGGYIRILKPEHKDMAVFREIYASGSSVHEFNSLMDAREHVEIHARLRFTSDDVPSGRAEFFGYEYLHSESEPEYDPDVGYVAPEGRVILVFSKAAS